MNDQHGQSLSSWLQRTAHQTIDNPQILLKQYIELFHSILEDATKDEFINFTTLFSRISYLGGKYTFPKNLLNFTHQFRKGFESKQIRKDNINEFIQLAKYVCNELILIFWKIKSLDSSEISEQSLEVFKTTKVKQKHVSPLIEVLISKVDIEAKTFQFYDDEDAIEEKKALYNIHDKNEIFTSNIDTLHKNHMLPIHANLLDCSIDDKGNYLPSAIVLHPDYLVDVTSIAECFKESRTEPYIYLLNKFKPKETSDSLLVGNMVNVMLDELVTNPNVKYEDILLHLFKSDPIGWAALDDFTTKNLIKTLQEHFDNLKISVNKVFGSEGIHTSNIYLEPSFYSRDYGLQGRLDLLHMPQGKNHSDIIELKSGKTFKPNAYKINESHYIQTLMYDLMIKSSMGVHHRKNYILYSKYPPPNLRHAPVIKQLQDEAMKLRNQLVSIEWLLQSVYQNNQILTYIKETNFPSFKGFLLRDLKMFQGIYGSLDQLEQSYFNHYVAFVAREHALSRTGEHGIFKSNGHASLWLETDEDKIDRFALFSKVKIIENNSNKSDATLVFSKPSNDQTLVNLRRGDIAVLYPYIENEVRPILKNQIFKCTIIDIDIHKITLKLRSKQNNQNIFKMHEYWNIEPDSLDSVFQNMYRTLFAWATADSNFRRLMLGRTQPHGAKVIEIDTTRFESKMTIHQVNILKEMIRARDFYLLWGPPGTGKTSVMLKNYVKYTHQYTNKNQLVIAYTNKAVDEICEAIHSAELHFIRIGSTVSTSIEFHPFLLDYKVQHLHRRTDINEYIASTKIFVSTVASIIGRPDIFAIKDFDEVIIDEASQILEPMIIGFLSKFKKCILIGDHKQLPAVVVQGVNHSRIQDAELNKIQIYDTRISLFERMYMQAEARGDFSRIGILSEQGRMNADIMTFVNRHFYDGQLKTIPNNPTQYSKSFFDNVEDNWFYKRMKFIATLNSQETNWKTNEEEAENVVLAIQKTIDQYKRNNKEIYNDSIGVITPYRAQIALIKQRLDLSSISSYASLITIDTVERYQGGARDIIIVSFCVNRKSQLDSLISPSLDGIDRKLNVALTRAREHIIMFGNKEILSENEVYKNLITWCEDA